VNETLRAAFDFSLIVLASSAPILFAALGALVTEYAGVLAVFMDGAITLSGFLCVALAMATGSPVAGFALSAAIVVLLMGLIAVFTEKTGANPFLTGLAVNFLSQGLTSLLSVAFFGTRGVIPLETAGFGHWSGNFPAVPAAFLLVPLVSLLLRHTSPGIILRVTGSAPDLLVSRGIRPSRYRTLSWCVAALFASCAGASLAFNLGAFTPGLSAGRGWTALAAVYLGYKKPFPVALAVIVFAAANHVSNGLQGAGAVPATVILGLPYALALVAFILIPAKIANAPGSS